MSWSAADATEMRVLLGLAMAVIEAFKTKTSVM